MLLKDLLGERDLGVDRWVLSRRDGWSGLREVWYCIDEVKHTSTLWHQYKVFVKECWLTFRCVFRVSNITMRALIVFYLIKSYHYWGDKPWEISLNYLTKSW